MFAELSAAQLAEMEAYSLIELDPEGEEARKEKERKLTAERLARQKGAFTRVAQGTASDHGSDA